MRTIETLRPLGPSFVSVTRTGGKPRSATIELVARIAALGIPGAAHITGIEATRAIRPGVCELEARKAEAAAKENGGAGH